MSAALSNRWVTFAAQSLLFFLVSAATFSSLGVVLPAMVRELHWTWTEAGLGYTFLGLSCGLSSVAAAALIRRIGVRATLLFGTALLVLGFAALAITHAVWLYLTATLLIGVAFALCTTVPGTLVLTGLFERQSTLLGAYFTLGALGGVAGPLLYVWIAPGSGWRAYWWAFVIASALGGAFAAATTPKWLDRENGADPATAAATAVSTPEWSAREAMRTPQFMVIVCIYTVYLLINTTAHGFAVEHLIERGISTKAAAGMLSLEALIGAAISVVGGIIGEKISHKTLLVVALIALIGGMVALAEARAYPLMLGYAIGVGVGFGLSVVTSTMLLLNYFGRRAFLELYSVMCLLSTAAAAGPAFGGWARDALGGFSGVFLLCALAALAMLIAAAAMRAPRAERLAPPRTA